jgi:hypothetical protein
MQLAGFEEGRQARAGLGWGESACLCIKCTEAIDTIAWESVTQVLVSFVLISLNF